MISTRRTRRRSSAATKTGAVGTAVVAALVAFLLRPVSALGAAVVVQPYDFKYPETMTIRAKILTNTVPLAYTVVGDEESTSTEHTINSNGNTFPQYRGFQPDLLRHLQRIAKSLDNVTLYFQLEEAPPFSYVGQFEYMTNDCGHVPINPSGDILSEEDCNRYDMIIGDYYPYPARSIRTVFTPPILSTAAATVKYVYRSENKRQITTLEEAKVLQEPICLLYESHYDDQTIERFPGVNVTWCYNHTQCVNFLKRELCVLFVEDELQLRYMSVHDDELEVTHEHFDEQYIVWPYNARLDIVYQQLLTRWIYETKVSGVLKQLYDTYFSINYCPIGRAGKSCTLPCSPSNGISDRYGNCVCDSIRYTGTDCSVEVKENKHLIPSALMIVCYVMIGINFMTVTICGIWMYMYRHTVQVSVAQPLFLGLVLLGCLISTSTIFVLGVEDEGDGPVRACMAIPWLYSVGFSVTFGTLFAKIRRVNQLFKAAAHLQRTTVTVKETILIVGGILAIDVGILTVWTVIDPLEWTREVLVMDQYGYPLSSEGMCTSENWRAFAGTIAALHFTLMAVASWLCYVSRDIPTEFSEGKYVTIAILSNIQIFIVGLPVLVIIGNSSETSFFVRSVIIWMNDFVVVTLIFGNLMYHVHHWDQLHPQRHSGQNSTSDNTTGGSSSRASFVRHAMNDYVANSRSRVGIAHSAAQFGSSPLEGEFSGGIPGKRSTYDGTVQRPEPLIPEPIEDPTQQEEDDDTETDQHEIVATTGGQQIPSVMITISESESEPRLRIDGGIGHASAVVPIHNVRLDASMVERDDVDDDEKKAIRTFEQLMYWK